MNKQEYNLSEKITDIDEFIKMCPKKRYQIPAEDVKEFIRLLKEKIRNWDCNCLECRKVNFKEIDKLAGEKLI